MWSRSAPSEPCRCLVREVYNGREDTYIAYWDGKRWVSDAYRSEPLPVTWGTPLPTPP